MSPKSSNKIYEKVWDSPFGKIWLYADEEHLLAVCFSPNLEKVRARLSINNWVNEDSKILTQTMDQLLEYFRGARKDFDLPLKLQGTSFQIEAWNALKGIPFGERRSYGEQAALIGREKAIRAIGAANGQNAISIIIPCHRVLGKNGKLVGYAGGEAMKRELLKLEGYSI